METSDKAFSPSTDSASRSRSPRGAGGGPRGRGAVGPWGWALLLCRRQAARTGRASRSRAGTSCRGAADASENERPGAAGADRRRFTGGFSGQRGGRAGWQSQQEQRVDRKLPILFFNLNSLLLRVFHTTHNPTVPHDHREHLREFVFILLLVIIAIMLCVKISIIPMT